MPDTDLDEVDFTLLDLISYVRRYGISQGETERFLRERLQNAFDVIEDYEDEITTAACSWGFYHGRSH